MPTFCMHCGVQEPAGARYCHQCGKPLDPTAVSPSAKSKWYHNIWFVLFLLFFVLGPFGLPLVWKNPRFAPWVRWLLTLAMVVYTILLIQMTMTLVRVVTQSVNQMTGALQLF